MSPGFINNKHYPNEMFYVWVFDLEENHALQLSFHNFDLEDSELCKKDVLLVSCQISAYILYVAVVYHLLL